MTDNTATDRKNNEPGVGKIENVDDHARHMSVYKDVANGELHSIHIPRDNWEHENSNVHSFLVKFILIFCCISLRFSLNFL